MPNELLLGPVTTFLDTGFRILKYLFKPLLYIDIIFTYSLEYELLSAKDFFVWFVPCCIQSVVKKRKKKIMYSKLLSGYLLNE